MRISSKLPVLALLGLMAVPSVRASAIEKQPPAKIFAAVCSTCHGAAGKGGMSWVDRDPAPWLGGLSTDKVKEFVRTGYRRSMPGFGKELISDAELDDLANFIHANKKGVPAPVPPPGDPVVVNILDADPWYADDGTDLSPDSRRVQLTEKQYVHVVNTGRTWHTITNDDLGKDSGYIGNAQYENTGYYDADPKTNLATGCVAYHCHMHPYMQVEICTPQAAPKPLTRLNKNPLPAPQARGTGELWVSAQTQEEDASDPLDGALQSIDTATWSLSGYVANVGNNPHSSWPGKLSDGRNILTVTNWHDNILTLIDSDKKSIIGNIPTGAAPAHLQVSPTDKSKWVVTHHGADFGVEELIMDRAAMGLYPIVSTLQPAPANQQSGAHGVWFCDDGDHFITANTFSNSVSLYSMQRGGQVSFTPVNARFPLNVAIAHGDPGGCRRGYSTNFDSSSISILNIDVEKNSIGRQVLEGPLSDDEGNLRLTDTSTTPVTWGTQPTQSVVSPSDSSAHGQFLIVSNKGSMNATIVRLDAKGLPLYRYNFPAGFGAHGVTFSPKSVCDSGKPGDVCYYAYIANTFDDYVSVYDLEKIENGQIGAPGSSEETAHVEGLLAERLADDLKLDRSAAKQGAAGLALDVPVTIFCPDCRSGGHVGDVLLHLTTTGKFTYIRDEIWLDDIALGGTLHGTSVVDVEAGTNTGGFGITALGGQVQWR